MPTLLVILITTLTAPVSSTEGGPSPIAVPDYRTAPVFFEMFHEHYSDDSNLVLLHEGKVRLAPLGIESIEGFDWRTHSREDRSWWVRVESLLYLLPLIASEDDRDRAFVKDWVVRWLDAHEPDPFPNKGCRDAMAAGQRIMVLMWFSKELLESEEPDTSLAKRIESSIRWHREYLYENHHAVSNHAMWEAMGLFETTRVNADSTLAAVALKRLVEIVRLSTTGQGFHTEHSPAYHFYFLKWLSDFVSYFSGLPDLSWPDADVLVERERLMHKKAYFLCDRRGRIPQIGDTDSMRIQSVYGRRPRRSRQTAVFDPEAGYALYKDPVRSRTRRYVVFRIPEEPPVLRFHIHADCISVYYSWDGEVILADAGRYSYDRSPTRRYYTSFSAHNTVMPSRLVPVRSHRVYANETWWDHERSRCVFGASLKDGTVTRAVEIPADEPEIRVFDTVLGHEPFTVLWHLGNDIVYVGGIERDDEAADPGWRRFVCELTTAKNRSFLMTIDLLCGEDEDDVMAHAIEGWDQPMLGWYSSGYKRSVPSRVIRVDLNVRSFANVKTRITRIR
jgi:hypothetical protein